MHVEQTEIEGVLKLTPTKAGDERGFFSEVFRRDRLEAFGVTDDWMQDNHALSAARGVMRGLHFQRRPFAQAKLIRVIRGVIFDVAVDIRAGSPTYGRHVGVELSAANWAQLYVPAGFAHGYCTLSENTEVAYKVSAPYSKESEGGLLWDDPELAIAWPIAAAEAICNDRDRSWPRLQEFTTPF
jgi:dTDP-4-dehydrorhamnose 3,5-epimerase